MINDEYVLRLIERIEEMEVDIAELEKTALTKDMFEWIQYWVKGGEWEQRIEKLEEDNMTTIEIIKEQDNIHFEHERKVNKEISELRNLVGAYRNYQNNCSYTNNIKEVLRDHLKSHGWVARDQLNPAINKDQLFKDFDNAIQKQLEKLDGDSKEKWQEHDEACYQYCSTQIDEMLKDGEKLRIENVSGQADLNRPKSGDDSKPSCKKCGTEMKADLKSLNEIDFYCPECCKKDSLSPLYEKEQTDDFIKVESKPYWLIPKDIDDFFRYYPSDGVRIKYERLIEKLPKKADLEDWREELKNKYSKSNVIKEIEKYLEDADES